MAKHFRRRKGRIILELSGAIDGSSAAEVCDRIERRGLRVCSLDFSRVKAIDLFGARVLASGLKTLRSHGVQFEVEALPEAIAVTLCLGGVLEALI